MSTTVRAPVVTLAGNLHMAAIERAYVRLNRSSAGSSCITPPEESSRLHRLCQIFSLSELERDLLLFAAALEVAPAIPDARALAEEHGFTTVEAAYELLGGRADWLSFRNALREDAPLRLWQLISLNETRDALPNRVLSADPRIVDFMLGGELGSAEISRLGRWLPATRVVPAGRADSVAAELSEATRHLEEFLRRPMDRRLFFVLAGGSQDESEDFAHTVVQSLGMPLLIMNPGLSPSERMRVLRESLLARAALVAQDLPSSFDPLERSEWYSSLARAVPIVFLVRPPDESPGPIPRPAVLARHEWVNIKLPPSKTPGRHNLAELSQRIPTAAQWADLVLPPEVKSRLEELCCQARHQQTVMHDGGFGRKLVRGRGVTGLFCGPSGTGKTMAAEVIAHHLGRELYRVDLARVVSKYIGETEKNLRRIFAEAERARCVLFFDEADALFGRRTEIRDSHDRYANLEVSYLLQLFEEAERAVVLLASNRRQAIDEAFARRFRFVIDFPMPGPMLRRELWQGSFSSEIPLHSSVSLDVLAERLPLSGASIRNIALASAFLAVSENDGRPGPVSAAHIVAAARRELEKLSSPMPVTVTELVAPRRKAVR